MQVASRLLLVWGIVYLFGEGGAGAQSGRAWDGMVAGAKGGGRAALFSGGGNAWVYAGMVLAWGVSEVVRYGYFVAVLGAGEVPAWLGWARYNAFFVLYPLGITCECLLVYAGHGLARAWEPLYAWFLVLVLAIYVPGMFFLPGGVPFFSLLFLFFSLRTRSFTNKVLDDCFSQEGDSPFLSFSCLLYLWLTWYSSSPSAQTGSYILYSHMMAQRRRVMRGKARKA